MGWVPTGRSLLLWLQVEERPNGQRAWAKVVGLNLIRCAGKEIEPVVAPGDRALAFYPDTLRRSAAGQPKLSLAGRLVRELRITDSQIFQWLRPKGGPHYSASVEVKLRLEHVPNIGRKNGFAELSRLVRSKHDTPLCGAVKLTRERPSPNQQPTGNDQAGIVSRPDHRAGGMSLHFQGQGGQCSTKRIIPHLGEKRVIDDGPADNRP